VSPIVPSNVEFVKPRIKTNVPDFVKKVLHPSEVVLAAFSASLFDHHRRDGEFRHDKFVLTSERIIYFHTGLIHKGLGEMPYKTITGISYDKGFRHGKVIVEAANAGLTMDGIGNDDAEFAEQIIAGSVGGHVYAAES
jgi:Bacterial PH domain